jgi:hypothetical protein
LLQFSTIGKWALIAFVCELGGCAQVAAYQRARLAHPTMNPENGQSAGLEHVRAVEEGAIGGHTGVSSGCGCN